MRSLIHFIRHGITQGIVEGWFYGRLDIPVVLEGFKELDRLKSHDTYPPAENAAFYTSGMLRANQTLKAIYGDVEHKEIPNLAEIDFGDWEGMNWSEVEDAEAEWSNWYSDPTGLTAFPHGDSLLSFSARIKQGLSELLAEHKEREIEYAGTPWNAETVMVCHGGVIAATMALLFPEQVGENYFKFTPSTGRGYTVEFKDGKAIGYKEI